MPALDLSPLTDPDDRDAARELSAEIDRRHGRTKAGTAIGTGCALLLVIVLGLGFTAAFALGTLSGGSAWWLLPAGVIAILTVWLCVFVTRGAVRQSRALPDQRWRITGFAAANGLELVERETDPPAVGSVIGRGSKNRRLEGVLRWPDRSLETGEYHATDVGYRGIESPVSFGYVRIALGGSAPPFLLDAKANNSMVDGGSIAGFVDMRDPTRRRAANGARFTLWAWKRDGERAAAFVDPELLDLLAARPVDLEVLGTEAFLYSPRLIPVTDPELWPWLLSVVDALRARTPGVSPQALP